VEREEAGERLGRLVDAAAAGQGAVVLVEGPAGIGKTSVLTLAADLVRASGGDVRTARAGPLERDLGWNIVRQLFADVIRAGEAERERLLSGANALGAPALGLAAGSDEGALHGLYWLTADLAAATAPVLLALDDAQWADAASLRFLAYLALRVDDLPVIVALTARPEGLDDEVLATIAAGPAVETIALRELSGEGSAIVTRELLGAEASPELCEACHGATSGNPFLLRELLGQLRREGAPLGGRDAGAAVDGVRPETVTRGVLLRLSRLSADARAAAEAVAILGDGATPDLVAALAQLDDPRTQAAIDELRAADILTAEPLGFIHPIVRRTIEAEVPASRLSDAHAAAARQLAARGAGPELTAMHLLHAAPAGDEWAVQELRIAARDALASGATETAGRYLQRALAEPPADRDLRAAVHYELGVAEARAQFGGDEQMLTAIELSSDPRTRAEIGLVLGHTRGMAGAHASAVDVFEAAMAERHDDASLQAMLTAQLALHCLHAAEKLPITFGLISRVDLSRPAHSPDEYGLRLVAAHGQVGAMAHDQARAVALQALADYRPSGFDDLSTALFVMALLVYVDELDAAIAFSDEQIDMARRQGWVAGVGLVSAWRAYAGWRRGSLLEAETDALAALDLLDSDAMRYSRAYVLSFVITVLAERGELDRADTVLDLAGPRSQWPQIWPFALLTGSAGRLRLAQGRVGEAIEILRDHGARFGPWRIANPSTSAWRSDLALALATDGRHDEARALAAAELELARPVAPPRALGVSLRVSGVVERGEAGIELLRESVAVLERSVSRIEHARALVDLGVALRQSGLRAEAREPLRAGLDLARRIGAQALASRAWDELVAAGGRPRGELADASPLLTPSEMRVARLAADGRTNREIAQALFVSLRTVETHLTHVYQKLDITSRSALAGAIAADPA
jgi:DNA-binding CsgD family transcriptional regulator